MSSKQPVVINGQALGKLSASTLLFKETWRFLKADKELLLLPVFSLLLNIVLFGVFAGLFVAVYGTAGLLTNGEEYLSMTQWAFLFGCYVVGAFSVALTQACVTYTVFLRAHGENATLGQSLKAGLSHWQSLFIWSLITSTVGIVLQAISERSKLLTKILLALLGATWAALTYFVVPTMVIDKKDAFSAVSASGNTFKKLWGEALISNVSLSFIFTGIHILSFLALAGSFVYAQMIGSAIPVLIGLVVYVPWFIALILVSSAMSGILKTLLYIYASETNYPTNFNQELLGQMFVRTTPAPLSPPASII